MYASLPYDEFVALLRGVVRTYNMPSLDELVDRGLYLIDLWHLYLRFGGRSGFDMNLIAEGLQWATKKRSRKTYIILWPDGSAEITDDGEEFSLMGETQERALRDIPTPGWVMFHPWGSDPEPGFLLGELFACGVPKWSSSDA
jgi:hypothetical protein